ncbi:MAG TPA: CDP-alcohol phosphatidyltransferase family protein [Kofleriaceae bacterium]|nr:CDP-alcohol phosphatidyltransferase family protein [Kofleriaceae bacterium]
MSVVYLVAEAQSSAPAMVVGGLTVLERKLLEAERAGFSRAVVVWDGPLPRRPLALEVERAESWEAPGDGAETWRLDEVAGVVLDSEAARRRAEDKLLWSLPKSFQGPVDAAINCHVSLRITRRLAGTKITPNQVTLAAFAIGIAAAALLFSGTRVAVAIAGVLMFFQSVVDSCDGELARLKFQFSRFGHWLDNVIDDVVDSLLLFALGVAAGWPAVGALAAAGRVFSQLALYYNVRRAGDGELTSFRWWFETEVASVEEVYQRTSALTWARSLGRRDVYVFAWAVLCVLGLPAVAAAYGAAMSAVFVAMTVLHLAMSRRR